MDEFVAKIASFASAHSLLPRPGGPVSVGLSGGVDSVALLLVLLELGMDVRACHCNFHLRGDESDRDERFCRDLCDRLGVKLTVRHFDVKARMEATGESVEMACRELRYGWWRNEGIETLAVAHHADDNAETLLLNLMRGAGIRGLKGMLPRNGHIIRPLLCAGRDEIEAYLASRGESHIVDSTNAATDFKRNRIRHLLLPEMERLFPGATAGIKRSLEALRGNLTIYDEAVDALRQRAVAPDGSIDLATVASCADPASALLELTSETGLNIARCREIMRPGGVPSGSRFGSMTVDHGRLYPSAEASTGREVRLDRAPFTLTRITRSEFDSSPRSRDTIYLDAAGIDLARPLTLRPWREGDRLAPYGMKGTRLVSDIFNDAKIGSPRRGNYPLLVDAEGRVLWICGLRASRHHAVTPRTEDILMIKYTPLTT